MTADINALFSSPRLEAYAVFLVIDHVTITEPIYLTTHTSDLTAKGVLWHSCQLIYKFPTRNNNLRTAELTVQNVDARIGKAAQAIHTPAMVYASVNKCELDWLPPNPTDEFEIEYPPMRLSNIQGNSISISGELVPIIDKQEPYPKGRATKSTTPGLYSDVLAIY